MALVSILLAVLAVVCTLLGFVTTPVPVLGVVFSFGAAAIALGGAMLAGKAISAAKRAQMPTDVARIAVVLNVLAFIPALLVALTCGVCNALVSTGNMQARKGISFGQQDMSFFVDAGPAALPPPGKASDAGVSPHPAVPAPNQPDAPRSPPGAMPPPPLPAGPGK